LIAGKPFEFWLKLFNLCYEFRYDGGEAPARVKNKVIKTGFYTRVCLPAGGSIMNQDNLTMEILQAMQNQFDNLYFRKVKK
jgi:hypothetical protein